MLFLFLIFWLPWSPESLTVARGYISLVAYSCYWQVSTSKLVSLPLGLFSGLLECPNHVWLTSSRASSTWDQSGNCNVFYNLALEVTHLCHFLSGKYSSYDLVWEGTPQRRDYKEVRVNEAILEACCHTKPCESSPYSLREKSESFPLGHTPDGCLGRSWREG